ncbi:ATPase, T2SS/T4P/T4SS family [Gracilibacillus sp. YIM 98692]|uniref:ATPase, T2SS/T4P/T4SS family n=1 Tax=Gracilibacillus sp. YIM 98692 TaxID=2663532 RepID=UPI0013D085B2|nr:ATPase, T2SS/T4P/T4SS family [Gracilibacillus sp. YIM 98692]
MVNSTKLAFHEAIEDIESKLQLKNKKPYDPSKWLSKQVETEGPITTTFARKKSFDNICQTVYKSLKSVFNDEDTTDQKKDEFQLQLHQAVIGNEQARQYFINQITNILRKNNITSDDYPHFYDSLSEAIFQEVYGVSILHKWEKYPESEAAVIRGTELWIDINGQFVKQTESFSSLDEVNRVTRTFMNRTKEAVINEQSPELEIEREDGSRITMIVKPRSRTNYVMFRRFIVKDISLAEQARLGTIRDIDIPLFQALSRTMPNTIFAGRVRSAKSTFMKSMIRERPSEFVVAAMEKHFELRLSDQLKDRLVFEIQAKEGDLHQALPRLLRMEHDYIVIGEIRSLETEAYLQACERGERGAATTYHLTDVEHVVPQITRHILDEFPNRQFDNEQERVARNVDLIITMSTDRDRRRKRVIGVTEVVWDEEQRAYRTVDLIRYSSVTNQYYYSSSISKRLLLLMAEENEEETKALVELLRARENESPMSTYKQIQDNILELILGEE